MEKTFAKVDELTGHIKDYVNNRVNSVKLSAAEKSSKLLANAITIFVSLLVFGLFLVFASFALAHVLAKLTGELYWGFLIVSGIYLIVGIMLWRMREKLIRLPILNSLLRQFFNEEHEKDKQYQATES